MSYLGITQPTAEWLFTKKEWLRALYADIPDILETSHLRSTVLIAGTLRAALTEEGRVLTIWNPDYLSNTGAEPWGFIRLVGSEGLITQAGSEEVFERCLYVINQRLQGLLLDGSFIHKSEDGVHSCLAGRGQWARQLSIAYVETELNLASGKYRSLVCVGPDRDLSRVRNAASREFGKLPTLTAAANVVIGGAVLRPPLEGLPSALASLVRSHQRPQEEERTFAAVPPLTGADIVANRVYETLGWSYEQWTASASSLTQEQRRILESDVLLRQPVRLIGAAGSGKTLLMELLAMRRLRTAEAAGEALRILYVVHNAAMMDNIWERFLTLGAEGFLEGGDERRLEVRTLFDYSRKVLGIEENYIIDPDAQATKAFQQQMAADAIADVFQRRLADVANSKTCPLLCVVPTNDTLKGLFSELVVGEIGVAIKGHGLESDRARYVGSERALSRLHGALSSKEREIIYDIFEAYHREVFERLEILDTDDLALSLLGRMRTPIWEMKRRKAGYDFVFVDEAQLFNENERRIFPLLGRGDRNYVPIALALDQAQEVRGAISAGLGLLGIKAIADERLTAVQRSTTAILRLAFSVIQRTTDLFGADFPDFTKSAEAVIPDTHPQAAPPQLVTARGETASFGKFVLKQVRALRAKNLRQVAVIVHAEEYWREIFERLAGAGLPLQVLSTRGERLQGNRPVVVLTQPAFVGGQEFDGVIVVGLEQGRVPPRVQGNEALAAALEQRALREIYVSFTRARYRVVVANAANSAPSGLLSDPLKAGLLIPVQGDDAA